MGLLVSMTWNISKSIEHARKTLELFEKRTKSTKVEIARFVDLHCLKKKLLFFFRSELMSCCFVLVDIINE